MSNLRDIEEWPRRGAVAEALGCSPTTIRRLEARGELHPIRDEQGARRFDPAELARLVAERGLSAPQPAPPTPLADEPEPALLAAPGPSNEPQPLETRVAQIEDELAFVRSVVRRLPPPAPVPCPGCGTMAVPTLLVSMPCCEGRQGRTAGS